MVATAGTPRARALSAALRAARKSTGTGVRELARMLSISHTQVSLWENGQRVPKLVDTAMIVTALRLVPEERDRIINLARKMDEPNWLTTGIPGIPAQLSGAMESERAAKAVIAWSPMLIPGLLQTYDYARAIATAAGLPPEEIEKRVLLRVNRREVLTTRHGSVKFDALISEAVLHEPVGDDGVMVDQLRHVAEMAQRSNITIQVLPLRIGWHPGWMGPFVLYEFPDASPMMHFEHYSSGAFVPDEHDVAEYYTAVETMRGLAMSAEASARLIANTADTLENT
jgi:transcriptional regulator with XRE-family HTH domain